LFHDPRFQRGDPFLLAGDGGQQPFDDGDRPIEDARSHAAERFPAQIPRSTPSPGESPYI
jgi:hypothetical protein